MIEVFASISSAEVGVRRAMLEEAGIPTFVRNEALSVLTNGFAAPFQPALCVINEEDYAEAMVLLRTLGGPIEPVKTEWQCPGCKERVLNDFAFCWNCETRRPETPSEGWQCPGCNESVPNTFDVCWKCETVRPDLDPAAS